MTTVEYAIAMLSLVLLVPNALRVRHEWHHFKRSRRTGEVALLVVMIAIPVLAFWQARLSDYASDVSGKRIDALESSTAARHLTPDQISILDSGISSFHGTPALIAADNRGTDSHGLAEEVLTQFEGAHWKMRGRIPGRPDVVDTLMTGGQMPEVLIEVADPNHLSPAAIAVITAFQRMGMGPGVQPVAGIPTSEIDITVGPRVPK